MSTNVPRVKSSDAILQAANVMNRERTSGAIVVEGEKVVGLITERALLWKFIPLDKRPDEVTVGDMLVPFFRIGPDESTKNAAKIMVENRITRLGVFAGEKVTPAALKFQTGITRALVPDSAETTVADLGCLSIRAISPKNWPRPSFATIFSPLRTSTDPFVMR